MVEKGGRAPRRRRRAGQRRLLSAAGSKAENAGWGANEPRVRGGVGRRPFCCGEARARPYDALGRPALRDARGAGRGARKVLGRAGAKAGRRVEQAVGHFLHATSFSF
jgi:hypothetical protein